MAVNEMKSKVMRVCSIGDQVGNLHIMCNNTELEQTTSFEYLGTIIHQNRKIEEVLYRVSKTNNIYYQLNQTTFGK
jgi:MinD-like ATPase involved in chromosome partitioning or flagellar assembly